MEDDNTHSSNPCTVTLFHKTQEEEMATTTVEPQERNGNPMPRKRMSEEKAVGDELESNEGDQSKRACSEPTTLLTLSPPGEEPTPSEKGAGCGGKCRNMCLVEVIRGIVAEEVEKYVGQSKNGVDGKVDGGMVNPETT